MALKIIDIKQTYFKEMLNDLEFEGLKHLACKYINEHNDNNEVFETIKQQGIKNEHFATLQFMYYTVVNVEGTYYTISHAAVKNDDFIIFVAYEYDNELQEEKEDSDTFYLARFY